MAKRRNRRGSYKYTARRRSALKKAQLASARKRLAQPNKVSRTHNGSGRKFNSAAMGGRRRKSHIGRNIALTTVGVTAVSAGGVIARHKISGSSFEKKDHSIVSGQLKLLSGSHTRSFDVTRPEGGGKQFSYHSPKQGPLGSSYTLSYNHKPLRMSKNVAGSRTPSKVQEAVVNGGLKTRGGIPVEPITEFIKGPSVSLESKDIRLDKDYVGKVFTPKSPRSKEGIQGMRLEAWIKEFDKRHKV